MLMAGQSTDTDILCLKSIKNSLEDPNNYLENWNFSNKTEGFICWFTGVECWHPDENRVLNLKLSNMGLKGQFPRGLQYCSSITGVDLSVNKLSGSIPSDISAILKYVTVIDLSNNKFTGEIPIDFAHCTYLNNLKLDNNMLSGHIPREFSMLNRLKVFDFSNNDLSGPVPMFQRVVVSNYANNNKLCGGVSLPPCSGDKFHQALKGGLIVGFASSLTCYIVVTYYISYSNSVPHEQLKKKKKKNRNRHLNKVKELGKYISSITSRGTQSIANHMHELLHPQLVEKGSKEISILMERLTSTI
ncbi:putative inactive leucine-rich repeat receptor protein kinase [Trifolium repens]|nr:putative inactive leucine-rich repeat receptor protein kinase [Trifolium repens]